MKKTIINQDIFAKYSIEDVTYELEKDEIYIEFYNLNINSTGCMFIELPEEMEDIETFVTKRIIEELKR